MDRVFSRGRDPYRYAESEYERARLAAMEEALRGARPAKDGGTPYRRALEIGAAEGAFTRRLAGLAGRVTGLDVSGVALRRAADALSGKGERQPFEDDGPLADALSGKGERQPFEDDGPLADAVEGSEKVRLVQADVRGWEPAGESYDAIVCGDVLYYMDKPLV